MKDVKRVFIPLTLDNSTKHFFSTKQMVGLGLYLLSLIGAQVLIIQLYSAIQYKMAHPGWIIALAEAVVIYVLTFIMRKVVLQENKMIQNYQDSQLLQKTDISFCWDIFAIRDNRIFYCNGMQGMIVCLSHGYLLDRPPDQEEVHRKAVKDAIGLIAKQGYSFIYFNREVQDSNLEPLREAEHRLSAFQGTQYYEVMNSILKHTYNVCSSIANTEQEYYLILAGNMETIRKLDHAANEFLDALRGGAYVRRAILEDREIWSFISEQFGTSFINPSSLLTKKFEHTEAQMVYILEVNRSDDNVPASQPDEAVTDDSDIEDWLKEELEQGTDTSSAESNGSDILI